MPTTDTSETGLEALIVTSLIQVSSYASGNTNDYDRDHAVDLAKLLDFLQATQPKIVESIGLTENGPRRQQFLHRLQGEIAKRGVIDVLRNGVKHGPSSVDLFYGTPSPGNAKATENFAANLFSITRQLRYSKDETRLALDLCIFINGLPIATFELKNRLTKQTVEDAVQQYKRDRDPREILFQFGRCVVHFALDDQEVRFCTHLTGKDSWFLPFNKGFSDGAGNPPNPHGLKTDYLWRAVLTREELTDILENYAQVVGESNEREKKKYRQIFPRYLLARRKIGGQARAMVVTSGIERAIRYFHAFQDYLQERKSPYKAIVAFSGEHDYGGKKVTEASLNGFPSSLIETMIQKDPYRFLIVADKFQTGYDEPLLHTMYVDKPLSGIKAVQTLSRLNRAYPQKYDTFVLDFLNDADTIKAAFEDYYRTTILSQETDPNKLHDLKAALDGYQAYGRTEVEQLVERYISGADRDQLDPILDASVAIYTTELNEDGQVDFKSKAKAFVRTYGFLASILPYTSTEWEKLSIFLNFLIPKLPAPKEEDLSMGILEVIDMDSYRVEVESSLHIALADQDAEIDPVPTVDIGRLSEPELDRLSNILKAFNDLFGNIGWKDADKIRQVIAEEIPAKVATDRAYQNAMKNSDKQNARIEHDEALQRVIIGLLTDHTELFRQFSDNPQFKKWLSDTIFAATYQQQAI